MTRTGHTTLKPSASSLGIVDRFVGDLQRPTEREARPFAKVLCPATCHCKHTRALTFK